MSLSNLLGAVAVLLTLISGILFSNTVNLNKASRYDSGELKPAYQPVLNATIDIAEGLSSTKEINKRVAGFCHHDYETITASAAPNYFDVFSKEFPGDEKITMRLEMDIYNIYDCATNQLRDSVVAAAQYNIDKLQGEAGYAVRIWFTEMPECLGQKIPDFVIDLLPEITGLLRPHVLPSIEPDKFQNIVEQLVRTFTVKRTNNGKDPVTLYEGWNEVESPGYFFGTNQLLVDNIMIPIIKAVGQVEEEIGYELKFASHSVANGAEGFTPKVNVRVHKKIVERGFDVDWINWHWYGTFPFHYTSPPGIEFLLGPMERNNPWATPKELYRQTKVMQEKFPGKDLMLSEWNWGAGGGSKDYDYQAAAYDAGAVIEMHHAGMADANNFLLKASVGFFNHLDQINPTGHAIRFFHYLAKNELPINGIDSEDKSHDISAIAAYDSDKINILLARFFGVPDDRTTTINFDIKNIRQLINSSQFTIKINTIDSTVFTGDKPLYTLFNLTVDSEDRLFISLEVAPQNTLFITIDTSNIEGIVNPIINQSSSKEIKIYPNPSNGTFNIEHPFEVIQQLKIYDLNGSVIYSKINVASSEIISELSAGTYIIELITETGSYSRKLIVTR